MLKVVCNLKKASIVFAFALIFSASLALLVGRDASALTGGTVDTDVRVRPSLTLNLTSGTTPTSNITLNLDPASNSFDYEDLNVSVGTNNAAGYVLTMSATDSNLVNVADSSKIIPTLANKSGGYTDADFTTNTWGYKNGTTNNYFPFVSGATILSNSVRTNNDTTTLRFAAKIDYTKPSGLYEQELNFTLTANMATYYMQDLDPAVCSTDPIQAIDTRDNNTYWIAELADGNCWMLQNLQLGDKLATSSSSITLTPANSNVSQNWVLTNRIFSPNNIPSTGITDDVTGNSVGIWDDPALICAPYDTNNYKSCYYNWYTATAGSGTSQVSGKDTTGVDVNESICPKGWVLPKSNANSNADDFQRLYQAMGSPSASQMLVDPTTATDNASGAHKPGLLLAGDYVSSGPRYMGTWGEYWARTAYSSGLAYEVGVNTSTFNTSNGHKSVARAVRCLRETRKISDIQNMQDISPAIVANTNNESATTLKDTRDNQEYTVAKLKDGKVWMTQNLKLGSNTTSIALTPTNSDVPGAGFTLDGKLSDGIFTNTTVDGIIYQNLSSQYYCTSNYGCYYNWYTATAGSGGTHTVGNVEYSICPAGWNLPTGGAGGDFMNLITAYGYGTDPNSTVVGRLTVDNPSSTIENNSGLPSPGFLYSGYYRHDGAVDLGARSAYWSSKAYPGTDRLDQMAEPLHIQPSSIIADDSGFYPKYDGLSIRCLAY